LRRGERLPGGVVIPGIATLAAARDRCPGVVAVVDDGVRFARHLLPLECLEGADLLGIDGVRDITAKAYWPW
jgi:hypothetical protein